MMLLLWLGSGFAFSVGVWFGAYMMRTTQKHEEKFHYDIRSDHQRQHEAMIEEHRRLVGSHIRIEGLLQLIADRQGGGR
jgi:hypothetical protein